MAVSVPRIVAVGNGIFVIARMVNDLSIESMVMKERCKMNICLNVWKTLYFPAVLECVFFNLLIASWARGYPEEARNSRLESNKVQETHLVGNRNCMS